MRVDGQKKMNHTISHLSGVKLAVHEHTREVGADAQGKLARHHTPEMESSVEVSFGDTDGFISLDDEAALSIEFGHFHNKSGEWVEGLYIISGPSGLI